MARDLINDEVLKKLQERFYYLIRERAGKLVDEQGLSLPEVAKLGATYHKPA